MPGKASKTPTVLPMLLVAAIVSVTVPRALPAEGDFDGAKAVYGWVEYVHVYPGALKIKAKLDTGANTSSMNALGLDVFERDGEHWARFHVVDPGEEARVEYERRVSRFVRIKDHDGKADRRPVVRMSLCLGRIHREVEFSLADRSEFNYQVLIGRNFLTDAVLVDAGRTFLASEGCLAVERR